MVDLVRMHRLLKLSLARGYVVRADKKFEPTDFRLCSCRFIRKIFF